MSKFIKVYEIKITKDSSENENCEISYTTADSEDSDLIKRGEFVFTMDKTKTITQLMAQVETDINTAEGI